MFKPKWKKEAKLLQKGAAKFLNYKRDLLEEDRIKEIESRISDLKTTVKNGDKAATREASKLLEKTCEQSLPKQSRPNAFQENIEVFFVAIVVALGIRAYFLQPFRIPTNSMYPTLNGITGMAVDKEEWPALPVRAIQQASHGRNFFSLTSENDSSIVSIQDYTWMRFFSRVKVTFSSGQVETFSGSATSLWQAGLTEFYGELIKKQSPADWAEIKHRSIEYRSQYYRSFNPIEQKVNFTRFTISSDQKILEGYTQSGDLIIVDKMSYHFKSPKSDDVLVFDTRGIKQIEEENKKNGTPPSHYIKRLIGTPGQEIVIQPIEHTDPNYPQGGIITRNGQNADDPGILRVQTHEKYHGYHRDPLRITDKKLNDEPSTGLSEYWAMGDNSYQSSDSRMWGTVKEYNVVGPAFLSLWPFGSGHWGVID